VFENDDVGVGTGPMEDFLLEEKKAKVSQSIVVIDPAAHGLRGEDDDDKVWKS
jgi:hypothetical protein